MGLVRVDEFFCVVFWLISLEFISVSFGRLVEHIQEQFYSKGKWSMLSLDVINLHLTLFVTKQ